MTTGTYILGALSIIGVTAILGVLIKVISPLFGVSEEEFDNDELGR